MSKTHNDEVYEAGVHAGQQGGWMTDIMHSLLDPAIDVLTGVSPKDSEISQKGYDYGSSHRDDKK